MTTNRLRAAAIVAICVLAVGIPVAPVAADETPPPPPAAYYGEVTIGGEPAPTGTVIEAQIDGEVRGSIIVDDSGVYGSSNGTSEKLTVDGVSNEAGANVTFLVNGVPADAQPATVEWESADHRHVNLSAPAGGGGLPPAPPGSGDANLTVTDAELAPSQIAVGETAAVTATVENVGDDAGITLIDLAVDGVMVNSTAVSLEAGETTTVTVAHAFDEAGRYDVSIGDIGAGALRVGSANLSVTGADVSANAVAPGDEVDVTAPVENAGELSGTLTADLTIDGTVVDSRTVDVGAGEGTSISFSHTFADEGEYAVAVNDEPAGTVSVSDDEGGDGIPGFGIAGAVAALLTLSATARWRFRE